MVDGDDLSERLRQACETAAESRERAAQIRAVADELVRESKRLREEAARKWQRRDEGATYR